METALWPTCRRQSLDRGRANEVLSSGLARKAKAKGSAWMFVRLSILAIASIASSAHPTIARDANGFIVGGGVGSLGCPAFLNAMATARQEGGLRTVAGIRETTGYEMYLAGFETGFNSEAEGIYDIFETLGPEPTLQALYAVEPWCASNPDKTFGKAVVALSLKLRSRMMKDAPVNK